MSLPETVTIPNGATRWGVSKDTLRRAIRIGALKAYKPGKEILIDVSEGDSWWRSSGAKLIKVGSRRRRK